MEIMRPIPNRLPGRRGGHPKMVRDHLRDVLGTLHLEVMSVIQWVKEHVGEKTERR